MLENSFYWNFDNHEDTVLKSNFIAFIQEKNHESHSHQRVTHHGSTNSNS